MSEDTKSHPAWSIAVSLLNSAFEQQGDDFVTKNQGNYAFKDQSGKLYEVEYLRTDAVIQATDADLENSKVMFVR